MSCARAYRARQTSVTCETCSRLVRSPSREEAWQIAGNGERRFARLRLPERLGAQHAVTAAELVLVSGALLVLAALVFGGHVLHGGLYSDDWGNGSEYRFVESPHYLHAVEGRAKDMGSRPVLALLLPLSNVFFGTHAAPQLAVALLLGALTCLLLYLLLRTLGLAPVHSGAIAALVLLFPWADSIRLWATASLNTVALCFGLLGLTVAVRSIRRDDRKSGRGHMLAIALFVLSILTYELMALALLLTGLFYRGRAARSRVLRWWLADALAVGSALIYTAVTTTKQAGSASHLLHNVPVYARQSLAVLSLSFVPPGVHSTMPRLLGLAVAGLAVAVLVRRQRRRPEAETKRLLVLIVAAALLIPCAYVTLIDSYVAPLDGGYGNRGNLFAALGYAALAYGLALAVAKAVARSRRRLEVVIAMRACSPGGSRIRGARAGRRSALGSCRRATGRASARFRSGRAGHSGRDDRRELRLPGGCRRGTCLQRQLGPEWRRTSAHRPEAARAALLPGRHASLPTARTHHDAPERGRSRRDAVWPCPLR